MPTCPTPRISIRRCLPAYGAIVLLAACALIERPPTPPEAAPATPQRIVLDSYHGELVSDPFRWLEDLESSEVQIWMHAQARYSRSVLDRIGGRGALLARMFEVENSAPARVARVSIVASGNVFLLRRDAGTAQHKLVVRSSVEAPENVVVDPARFGPKHAIDYSIPSPDGRFVAYGVSEAGSEDASLYLHEVASGVDIVGPIAGAKFNGSSPYRWAGDSSAVYFETLREPGSAADKSEAFQWLRGWRLAARAGAVPQLMSDARRAIGPQRSAHEHLAVLQFGDSPVEVAVFEDGVRRDIRASVRPAQRFAASFSTGGWLPLIAYDDGIAKFEIRGDRVYALTRIGAERFRVVSTSVSAPDWARARLELPEQAGVLRDIAAAQDALYAVVLEGGSGRLLRLPYVQGQVEEIALPFAGALRLAGHHVDRPGVLIELGGWTQAPRYYRVAAGARVPVLTALQPSGAFDTLHGVASRIEHAVSHDGVKVPLSIVAKPDASGLGGPRPTIIVAYGAYGLTQDPRLRAEWVPWLERGYVMATCHVRGGGEYGQAWTEAGRRATKPNSWKDLIGCAEHLVKTGVSTPRKLGIMGWSAGGITVGRALTERPDLFAAAAPAVGVLDALRFETERNGPANTVEFGSVAKPDEFRALYAMSAYHHVRLLVRYPAVILAHGATDPRVAVWHSSKMAAALRAADTWAPVLLNIDFDAGHGRGSSTAQRLGTFADSLAFMLWQFGEPGFGLRER
ncbi:MAG: prolyl oligopeptidase family serine peptidase [Burkholderiaceae bacterium]